MVYPVLANAGLPMIGVQMDLMLVALLPIIAIEAIVLRVRLAVPLLRSLKGASLANALSTLAGIPLTWLALVFIEMAVGGEAWGLETPLRRILAVTVQAPVLLPYEGDLDWMVPAASLFLLLPCLVVSILIESRTLSRLWPEVSRERIWRAASVANFVSYALLSIVAGFRLHQALTRT